MLRDLWLRGPLHYGDLVNPKENIATNILADRLKALLAQDLVIRQPDPDNDGMMTLYALTAKGLALRSVLMEMAKWGLEHGPSTLRAATSPAVQSLSGEYR